MGQAKQRGSYEQRVSEAGKKKQRVHVFINENRSNSLFLDSFPCADCRVPVTPNVVNGQMHHEPVRHAVQVGVCAQCGAVHLVASAGSKDDCLKLQPVLAEMSKSIGAGGLFGDLGPAH